MAASAAVAVSVEAVPQEGGKMKQLNNFITELKDIFGKRLKSIFIYGSKACLDEDELESDINLMIVTDVLTGDDLKKCSESSLRWMGKGIGKKRNPEPVFMGENEWFNSADVYAMEYADIKENHKILFGENLICNIKVKKEDLRFQCEAETKNLLMRFRSHYLRYAKSASEMQKSITPVIKTCIAIFKAILRIKNIEVPKSKYEIVNKIHQITAIDKPLFEKLLCSKEKFCSLNKKETYETADAIVIELTKLLGYVNNL